jgi:hypothetical protein
MNAETTFPIHEMPRINLRPSYLGYFTNPDVHQRVYQWRLKKETYYYSHRIGTVLWNVVIVHDRYTVDENITPVTDGYVQRRDADLIARRHYALNSFPRMLEDSPVFLSSKEALLIASDWYEEQGRMYEASFARFLAAYNIWIRSGMPAQRTYTARRFAGHDRPFFVVIKRDGTKLSGVCYHIKGKREK